MRRDQANASTGSDLLKLSEGHTLIYICPAVHDSEPVPYAEARMAFGFGPKKAALVSIDGLDRCQPILDALAKKHVTYEEAVAGSDRAAELIAKYGDEKRNGFKNRWWFNVVVMGHRVSARKAWDVPEPKVVIFPCGKSIFDGIVDQIFEIGDVSDYDAATFIKIKRSGSGLETEYKVDPDVDSLKNPVMLDDDFVDMLENALQPGKANDLHAEIVKMVKRVDEIDALWDGTSDGDDDGDEPAIKRKAAISTRSASSRASSRRKKTVEIEEDEVEEDEVEEDEVEEEDAAAALEAALSKRRRKKKSE